MLASRVSYRELSMSKHVAIVTTQGRKYVRVVESYRNADGKPRSRLLENHGNLDVLEQEDPDYLKNLRARVAAENEAVRKARLEELDNSAQTRIRKLEQSQKGADYSCAARLKLGAAVIRQVWKDDLNLPQVFRYLQSKRKIEYSYDKAAFLLCSQRIVSPGSKKKAFEERGSSIVPFDGIADNNVVYRVLDRLAEDKEAIVKHLNREISSKLNRTVSAAFYDVTTYAFESRKEGELRQFGLSKDHKVNEVQVVLGLVMDAFGIPIDYELFPGSTSEFGTMLPMIRRIKTAYDLKTLIVVADRGLNSNENLLGLKDIGCDFVLAQKVKNSTKELRKQILDDGNWDETVMDGDEIVCRYKTMDLSKTVFETKISKTTGRKYQSSKKVDSLDVRWIVSHSQSRANKDNSDIDRAVEKAKKALRGRGSLTSSRGYRSLIKVPKGEGEPSLDMKKIEEARRWAGYYAVCTNLKTKSSQDIMKIYRNLWRIEDCFRVSKTTLEARPCFVWTDSHVRGHFASCFISLVIEKYMQHVLKQKIRDITCDEINAALRGAEVALDDGNPQMPLYLRLYPKEGRFDSILRAFSLEPPCHYETAQSLCKKLRLKDIARPKSCTTRDEK